MMAYVLESGDVVAPEIAQNVNRHMKELVDNDDTGAVNIDWDYYLQMSKAGLCKVFTMRDGQRLVGYFVMMLSTNPRNKDRLEAMCDGLFIEKPYRKHSFEFMDKLKETLKKMNVSETSILISDDKVARFLGKFGFKETKKLWSLKYE